MIPSAMNMHTYLDGLQDRQGSYTARPCSTPVVQALAGETSWDPDFLLANPHLRNLVKLQDEPGVKERMNYALKQLLVTIYDRVWCLSASSICKWRLAFSSTFTEMIYTRTTITKPIFIPRRPGDGCGVLLIRDALKGARHQSFVFSGLRY